MRFFFVVVFLLPGLMHAAEANDIKAFESLVSRITSGHKNSFRYEYIKAGNGYDVFELSSEAGKIILKGNNNNSLAVALNHYLKYYCYTTVSWYADDPIELPAILPLVDTFIRKEARAEQRFFLNYCTFGYTFTWWQWRDWERLIDWMALNGINMPLAITGQEAIWLKVWKQFGLTDMEIRAYFTGPAHLPWHRMSNIDKWQGPLPMSYISHQLQLQKKILARERSLGMKPILPAFSGHVPEVLSNKYPDAKISKLGQWSEFPEKYRSRFLDPFDPLFKKIQVEFLKEQTRQFGTDHLYGSDPFNEVTPPSWDTAYLAKVSNTIYSSMYDADPQAKWIMMSWIFYFEREHWTNERIRSFVRAVPQDKIILLDYYGEHTEVWKLTDSYFKQPYIWCYLGNFGGNTMLAGNFKEVGSRIENAYVNGGTNMSGVGSTLEGLNDNPLMYDLVFEKAWGHSSSPTDWVNKWSYRRMGRVDTASSYFWSLLADSIYISPAKLGQGTLTNARPSLTGHGNWTTNPEIQYSNSLLCTIWEGLAKTEVTTATSGNDLVNIGRQVLGNYFQVLRDSFAISYQKRDTILLKEYGRKMLEILDDLDMLLSSGNNFLLGKWLNNAKQFGKNRKEKKYYEQNARIILTTWSAANHMLNDYANRASAGLVNGFYKKRWSMFISEVSMAATTGQQFDEKSFLQKVTSFEWEWTQQRQSYSIKPIGDPHDISRRLIEKYTCAILKK